MKHSQEEREKKSPKNNKKISQTTKHSASVLCQSSVLCFPPDCLPRNEEINQKQDTGSFSLVQSFHRGRRDYAEGKQKDRISFVTSRGRKMCDIDEKMWKRQMTHLVKGKKQQFLPWCKGQLNHVPNGALMTTLCGSWTRCITLSCFIAWETQRKKSTCTADLWETS